jgi:competence protein ComGC
MLSMEACVSKRRATHEVGLTLVEILITLVIFVLIAGLGFPALQQLIQRSKTEGFARTCSVVMHQARFEAIKRGVPCVVRFDPDTNELVSYADVNRDGLFNPDTAVVDFRSTDYIMRRVALPVGVDFGAPDGLDIVEGFTLIADLAPNVTVFRENGSVDDAGALRVLDSRGNFLEIRVAPAATARVTLQKWDGSTWALQGEGGHTWEWH